MPQASGLARSRLSPRVRRSLVGRLSSSVTASGNGLEGGATVIANIENLQFLALA
jgi:hypothetical protein